MNSCVHACKQQVSFPPHDSDLQWLWFPDWFSLACCLISWMVHMYWKFAWTCTTAGEYHPFCCSWRRCFSKNDLRLMIINTVTVTNIFGNVVSQCGYLAATVCKFFTTLLRFSLYIFAFDHLMLCFFNKKKKPGHLRRQAVSRYLCFALLHFAWIWSFLFLAFDIVVWRMGHR